MVNPETIFNQTILCPLLAPPPPCLSLDFVVVEGVVVVGFADLEVSPYKLNVELLLALQLFLGHPLQLDHVLLMQPMPLQP
jgi:hypothetical protein